MVTDTYQLTPFCFAKTEWICEQVRNCGGRITLVPPALDLDVFYPRDNAPKRDRKVLLTMLRPSTPQRGTETAVRVLRQLSRERDDLEIHTFGADDVELEKLGLDFPIVNHGKVRNAALPQLYSTAYVYMDCSLFHGFGRTIAEAMACGTPAVVTDSGGVSSFAVNDVNCLIAAPGDTNALLRNLRSILDDSALHSRLAARTYESVKGLDRRYSSAETVGFLTAILGQFPKVSPSGDGDAS